MTAEEFRALALAVPGAVEGSHVGHPDFRANGRLFAGLGGAHAERATVLLPPEEQAMRIEAAPDLFSPCTGAWGRSGWTYLALAAADESTARGALTVAHAAVMAKPKGRSR